MTVQTALAEKAFEALQVVQRTESQANTLCTVSLLRTFFDVYIYAQAEQDSTEFRIKALGKALEFKHLEVFGLHCLRKLCYFLTATLWKQWP